MKSKTQENNLMNGRIKILVILFSLMYLIIISRVVHLQFIEYDKYKILSDRNVMKERSIPPTRSIIKDRNGRIIADNRPMYYLTITPELINNYKKEKMNSVINLLEEVSQDVSLSSEEISSIVKSVRLNPKFQETIVKLDISESELSKIVNKIKFISGIKVHSTFIRNYPENNLFLQSIGYVGLPSKEDFANYRELTNLDYVGKSGIEKSLQNYLHGTHGIESYKINATGKVIESKIKTKPIAGPTLTTTFDISLQRKALELMGDKKGAVVALDPNNGDVLVMVSTPTFDANQLVKGLTQQEYDNYVKSNSPLLNRATQGLYPPASTFKPFIAMAALEGNFVNPMEKINSGPYFQISGSSRKFLDWKKWGHGKVDLRDSLEVSSDVYYYKLGYEMGVDYIHDFVKNFGFGQNTGIEVFGERSGLLPSSEWKKKNRKENWYKGESVISAIGQGYNLVTPLQMATSLATLVNGGTLYKPKINLMDEPTILNKINLDELNINHVKEGMANVLHGKKGTARAVIQGAGKIDFKMGGKTGTAQIYSTHGVKDKELMENMPDHLKDHAMFTAFAPFENPQIVIAVVVENGESGSKTAAPIAVQLAKQYINSLKERTIN